MFISFIFVRVGKSNETYRLKLNCFLLIQTEMEESVLFSHGDIEDFACIIIASLHTIYKLL